jgi:hypothetical protein
MDKILYKDVDKPRLLKGEIIPSADSQFVKIRLDNGSVWSINKNEIISMREGEQDEQPY